MVHTQNVFLNYDWLVGTFTSFGKIALTTNIGLPFILNFDYPTLIKCMLKDSTIQKYDDVWT